MFAKGHLINKICETKTLPLLMGILNVTHDSFSDGNKHLELSKAVEHAKMLIADGADIIDIGGESTRPGAALVDVGEEIERVIPVTKAIREFSDIPISIDTRKSAVARLGINAGANIINDVSALRFDYEMVNILKDNPHVCIILMHMLGKPETMQLNPQYKDVLEEIRIFFTERISFCKENGISESRILLDPGIGFGKATEHNLEILANLQYFKSMHLPLVVGASRKRFINDIQPSNPNQRLAGSLAATEICLDSSVDVIRVHDIKEHFQFIKVLDAIIGKRK